jgi:HK97 family phage major capsid protein
VENTIEQTIVDGITSLKGDIATTKEALATTVKKDELDAAIAKAASLEELKALAADVTVTKDLAEKLNEKVGQINAPAQQTKQSWSDLVSKAIVEKATDIEKAISKPGGRITIDLKAAGVMDFPNNFPTADVAISDLRPGIVGLPNRRLHIRQLLAGGSTGTSTFVFVAETGGEGAPDLWTNYATSKPLVDRDFEEKEAPVRDIASITKISRRMVDDKEGMQSFLQNRLVEMHLDKEDNVLLYGPNNTAPNLTGLTVAATGSISGAARTIDKIMLTMAGMKANNYFPNGILVNPITYAEILLNQATDKSYSYPVVFNAQGQLTLGGIPVFEHPEMLATHFLVGDWTNGAQLITRQAPTVEIARENEDDFRKNLIAIRVEGRIALPIYYPAGWAYGTKGTFSGS